MSRIFGHIISVMFHPLFVNLFALLVLFFFFPSLSAGLPAQRKFFYMGFIFCSGSLFPLLSVLLLRISGAVKSITLENAEERRLPYLVTVIAFMVNYYLFLKLGTHPLILSYLLACSSVSTLVLIINHFYKISIHMAALGSLIAIFCVCILEAGLDLRPLLVSLFLLTGIVGSARLLVSSHDPGQLYTGLAAGFIPMFFIL